MSDSLFSDDWNPREEWELLKMADGPDWAVLKATNELMEGLLKEYESVVEWNKSIRAQQDYDYAMYKKRRKESDELIEAYNELVKSYNTMSIDNDYLRARVKKLEGD